MSAQREAPKLIDAVNKIGIFLPVTKQDLSAAYPNVRARQYEIWFAPRSVKQEVEVLKRIW